MADLVQGGEVLTAIEASAVRAREIGYDEALVELGFDPAQLREACRRNGVAWLDQLPLNASIGDVVALLAASELEGLTAGIRLGRMYSPAANGDSLAHLETRIRRLAFRLPSSMGATVTELGAIADELATARGRE